MLTDEDIKKLDVSIKEALKNGVSETTRSACNQQHFVVKHPSILPTIGKVTAIIPKYPMSGRIINPLLHAYCSSRADRGAFNAE